MEKIKSFLENPYYRALLWLALGVIIFFVGITRPKADSYATSYADTQRYYDNSGSSLRNVGATWVESLQGYLSNSIYTVANSYGAAIAFNSPIPLIENHTYSLSIWFPERHNIAISSKPGVAIGTSFDNVTYRYTASTYGATTQYYNVVNNTTLQYVFRANSNNGYILLPWTTTSSVTQDYNIVEVIIDDLGASGVSQSEINASLSNQTNIINNSISTSENNIRSAIGQTEQNIIDNQNANQEQTNELLGNCYSNLWNNGDITGSRDTIRSLTQTLEPGTYTISYNLTSTGSTPVLFQIRSDNAELTSKTLSLGSGSWTFTINSTATKFRLYQGSNYSETYTTSMTNIMLVQGSSSKPYDDFGVQHCTSKLDDTNQAINDVNDTLTDDSIDNNSASSFFEDFTVTDNGGISSIITAPLVAINAMLSNQCSPLSGTWRGQTFELPCGTDFWNRMSTIRTWLNVAIGGLLCYRIIIKLFKLIEGFKNPDNDRVEVMNL